MRGKVLFICTIIITISTLLQGCSVNTGAKPVETKSPETTPSETKSPEAKSTLISYGQYRQLFNDLTNKLELPDLSKVAATDDTNIVAVDKESSFGKRQYLTLTGEQSDQETQERIAYEDKDGKYVLFIDVIYLNKELDNDLAYWHTNSIDKYKDDKLIGKFDDNILSFHNTLVKITLFSKGDESAIRSDLVRKTTLSVVNFLNNYKFRND